METTSSLNQVEAVTLNSRFSLATYHNPRKSMSLEILDQTSQFEALREEWGQLTDEALRSFEWHLAWWKSYGLPNGERGQKLRLYGYRVDNKLVGILPLYEDRWLGLSRIRFLGSGGSCTDYAGFIGSESFHQQFLNEVAEDLTENLRPDLIELEGMVPEAAEPICKRILDSRYWKYERNLEHTWVLDLPESWEAFLSNSKKSLKRKIKKAAKRLESGEFEVKTTHAGLNFEEAFETLVQLHQDRFQNMGKSGAFDDPRFYQFLKSATESLHPQKKVEIVIAYHDNEPLIAQIYLCHPSGPRLYQAGIRSDKLNLEPGHLLFTFAVRRAIEQGCTQFDFLRGNQPYKRFWGAQLNELVKVRLVSNRLLPSTLNRGERFLRQVKKWVAGDSNKAPSDS